MEFIRNHNDIPAEMRHFILEETQEGRLKNVPIVRCNELIQEFVALEKELAKLKEFTVQYINRNGTLKVARFKNVQAAYVFMDKVIGHNIKKRNDIGMVCRQADRIIKVYYKGEYLDPPAKDAVRVRKAS